ncbi:MAG: methionine--tRNA ligase [Patescibacteria group bacterium]|nr:methionine--tRNA ligase [Patescibacteria group bacterium]
MANKFYITTPIYYVNDVPHIGHTCTTIAADIIARYHKILGDEVFFLTGTDEHGAKVAEAAAKEGLTPQEFTDKVSRTFSNIWPKLNISFDYFIRTTNPQHKKIVQEILEKIYQKGDIYKSKYKGLYCIGCEKYITESELVDGRCPLHPNRQVCEQEEENYFFRLSKYIPELIAAIEDEKNPLHYQIEPEGKRQEVLSRLKAGVNDLSISRAEVSWGIPLPWDQAQTIYVWVDALLNYYTATKIVNKENFWPANLHLIGKEILWFHTVIWQALLLAADIALPKEIFAHSFYLIDGQKMSKSLGNVISPEELLAKFGVDGTRYLIAYSFPSLTDSDVSWNKFKEKYNADLANGLGNLAARIARLAEKSALKFSLGESLSFSPEVQEGVKNFRFDEALNFIWTQIAKENKRINEKKPWELSGEELKEFLGESVKKIRQIAFDLQPFMPQTAEKISNQFQGPVIKSEKPLFPRI